MKTKTAAFCQSARRKYISNNRLCILTSRSKTIQSLLVIKLNSSLPHLPAHIHPGFQALCHVISATHNVLRYSAQAVGTSTNVGKLCSANAGAVASSRSNTACIACGAVVGLGGEARGRGKVETGEGCRLAETVARWRLVITRLRIFGMGITYALGK